MRKNEKKREGMWETVEMETIQISEYILSGLGFWCQWLDGLVDLEFLYCWREKKWNQKQIGEIVEQRRRNNTIVIWNIKWEWYAQTIGTVLLFGSRVVYSGKPIFFDKQKNMGVFAGKKKFFIRIGWDCQIIKKLNSPNLGNQ